MFYWAAVFFIIAIVAAVLGFSGIAGTAVWAAQLLFLAGLVLAIGFVLLGRKPPLS